MGPNVALLCVELAIVVRIHTCVLVRPCCRCQALLSHQSTNDGVELPDGTPRGVRDLYPVWLPCFFSPSLHRSLPPSSTYLFPLPFSLIIPRDFLLLPRGSCCTVAPATKMFCKTNVCICTRSTRRETPSSSETTLIDGESSPALALASCCCAK